MFLITTNHKIASTNTKFKAAERILLRRIPVYGKIHRKKQYNFCINYEPSITFHIPYKSMCRGLAEPR